MNEQKNLLSTNKVKELIQKHQKEWVDTGNEWSKGFVQGLEYLLNQEEINELEVYANQMKEARDQWQDDYYKMYAKFLSKSNKASELEIENNKLKAKLKEVGIEF